jgi:outer membrane PBP1 activator LpoA protein
MDLQNKLKHKDKNIQKVLDFVKEQAAIDEMLANKVLLETKTIDKMWNYITSEARKMAVKNTAIVDDQTVYGWALHYFIEVEQEKPTTKVETEQQEDEDETCEACSTETKKQEMEQMQLEL